MRKPNHESEIFQLVPACTHVKDLCQSPPQLPLSEPSRKVMAYVYINESLLFEIVYYISVKDGESIHLRKTTTIVATYNQKTPRGIPNERGGVGKRQDDEALGVTSMTILMRSRPTSQAMLQAEV